VDWWCTINEPEVYAFRAYSEGVWPPRRRDDSAALAVMANLLEAHGRAYRILHEDDTRDADGDGIPARVGLAKHWVPLEPLRTWFPLDTLRASIEHGVFNRAVAAAPRTGRIEFSIPGARPVRRHVPELAQSLDWYGLNYYTRWKVDSLGRVPHVAPRGARLTDLGWELHPAGFEQALVELGADGMPVIVTENGFADATDQVRPLALLEYLGHLGRAIDRGVKVLGYLHWSLLDNFEWAEGFKPRFGLYEVDFSHPDRPRTPRRSAALFAAIARANAITPEVAAEFVQA
jgi:beta-glucosidase